MSDNDSNQNKDEFLQAAEQKQSNLISELIGFMSENKKWWLSPIIVVLLLVGLLLIAGGSGLAPFIYTLF